MADIEIYEMISAFVLGCMNKENYVLFKDYHDNKGKLPLKYFSELQNIVSLIPVLLEISYPDPKLKDAVAKNILSYQEEIKAKIRAKKTATILTTQNDSTKKTSVETSSMKDVANETTKSSTGTSKSKSNLPDTPNEVDAKSNLEKKSAEKNDNSKNKTEKKFDLYSKGNRHKVKKQLTLEIDDNKKYSQISHKSKPLLVIFLSILIFTIIAGVYFYVNSNSLRKKVINLNREIILLKADMRKGADYINTNKKIVDFLDYNELDIVNLEKKGNSNDASGKLLISFGQKAALLDAENLPILPPGKVFQLWLITKDISYSLLKFIPSQGTKYYTMPKLPYVAKSDIDLIRITVEPDSGSEYPTGNTILFGGFSK